MCPHPQLHSQGTLRQNLLYPETIIATNTITDYQRLANEVSLCKAALMAAGLSSDDFLNSLPASPVPVPVPVSLLSARVGPHTDTLEQGDEQQEEGSKDWSRCCSLGEQQRIAAARLLIRRPLLVRM